MKETCAGQRHSRERGEKPGSPEAARTHAFACSSEATVLAKRAREVEATSPRLAAAFKSKERNYVNAALEWRSRARKAPEPGVEST